MKSKQDKRKEAFARQGCRDMISDSRQIKILKKRPGSSLKEITRLRERDNRSKRDIETMSD